MQLVIAEKPSVAMSIAKALSVYDKRTATLRGMVTGLPGVWGIWWNWCNHRNMMSAFRNGALIHYQLFQMNGNIM